MEVVRVEAAECIQTCRVWDDEILALQGDQPVLAQAPQNAVHMHVRQPHRVGKLYLGDRQRVTVVAGKPDGAQAEQELAE
jgi:hypothetical protein